MYNNEGIKGYLYPKVSKNGKPYFSGLVDLEDKTYRIVGFSSEKGICLIFNVNDTPQNSNQTFAENKPAVNEPKPNPFENVEATSSNYELPF